MKSSRQIPAASGNHPSRRAPHANLAVVLAFLLGGCGTNSEDAKGPSVSTAGDAGETDSAAPPGPAVAGTCSGEKTACTKVTPADVAAGPEVTCTLADGGATTVVWSASLDSVECPQGSCAGAFPSVAVASDGTVWAVASLVGALPDGASAPPLGRALARFDSAGKQTFAKSIDVDTRLVDTSKITAQGASVDGRGHLLVTSPSVGAASLELRDYDGQGALGPALSLVDRATFGNLSVANDGSLALAYEYAAGDAGAAPENAPQHVGIARFDAAGHLLWNQTALSGLDVLGWSTIVGLDARVGTTARVRVADAQAPSGRQLLVRLDQDGNIAWAQQSPEVMAASAAAAVDGSVYALTAPASGTPALVLDKVDAKGSGLWRVAVPGSDLAGSPPLIASLDEDGSAWIVWTGAPGEPATAIQVSSNGQNCTRYELDVPYSVTQAGGGMLTDDVRLAPVGAREFVFGSMTTVGRIRFP